MGYKKDGSKSGWVKLNGTSSEGPDYETTGAKKTTNSRFEINISPIQFFTLSVCDWKLIRKETADNLARRRNIIRSLHSICGIEIGSFSRFDTCIYSTFQDKRILQSTFLSICLETICQTTNAICVWLLWICVWISLVRGSCAFVRLFGAHLRYHVRRKTWLCQKVSAEARDEPRSPAQAARAEIPPAAALITADKRNMEHLSPLPKIGKAALLQVAIQEARRLSFKLVFVCFCK